MGGRVVTFTNVGVGAATGVAVVEGLGVGACSRVVAEMVVGTRIAGERAVGVEEGVAVDVEDGCAAVRIIS